MTSKGPSWRRKGCSRESDTGPGPLRTKRRPRPKDLREAASLCSMVRNAALAGRGLFCRRTSAHFDRHPESANAGLRPVARVSGQTEKHVPEIARGALAVGEQ